MNDTVKAPIVEFVGLPGSGKTTICKSIQVKHYVRGEVKWSDVRFDSRYLAVVWDLALLGLGSRPFTFARMRRVLRLIWFGRHYFPHDKRPLLIHQGWIQKLWAILVDAKSYPAERLDSLFQCLAPFFPDVLVVVEVPIEVAVDRIHQRSAGRSRYDKLPQGKVHEKLAHAYPMLMKFTGLIGQMPNVFVQKLDGLVSLETNRQIVELLASQRTVSENSATKKDC